MRKVRIRTIRRFCCAVQIRTLRITCILGVLSCESNQKPLRLFNKPACKSCTKSVMSVQVSVNKEDPPTDEERLNLRLDRFLPVNGEERRRVVGIALE